MRVCNNSFFFPLFLKVTWSSSTCKCRLRWRNATHKCSKGCKWASPSGILCSPDWSINTQTFCFAVCGVSPKISRQFYFVSFSLVRLVLYFLVNIFLIYLFIILFICNFLYILFYVIFFLCYFLPIFFFLIINSACVSYFPLFDLQNNKFLIFRFYLYTAEFKQHNFNFNYFTVTEQQIYFQNLSTICISGTCS